MLGSLCVRALFSGVLKLTMEFGTFNFDAELNKIKECFKRRDQLVGMFPHWKLYFINRVKISYFKHFVESLQD